MATARWKEGILYLPTAQVDSGRVSDSVDGQNKDDAVTEADIGRVITDPYELKLLRNIINSVGRHLN